MLKESARDFFSKELDSALVRELEADDQGYSPKLWAKMARLGWMGLLVPEVYGGEGMELLDMAVVLEEMGHAACSSPFFSSAVVSALLLLHGGTEAQKKKFLPDLASGKKIFTSACDEQYSVTAASSDSLSAVRQGESYVLSGTKWFVPYAHVADYIITAARTGESGGNGDIGPSLFIVDRKLPGVTVEPVEMSTGERLCEVRFNQVAVPAAGLLGKANHGLNVLQPVFQMCAVAKAAEMIGAGEKVLKMTVDYAKKREQFGRPIGSFQAIQHHCADMKTYLETSVLVTYQACSQISQKRPWEKQAAICKAWVNDSLKRLVALGHQIMGGFGFMEEADHQLYFRRIRSAEFLFGDARHHREVVAQKMGL
ncbi:MAG: acyl-CoA dehydrogenase family protein [Terriglobales bacterium]